jgi:2-polyprenyl-3-methyl-5-hydroxy-6-metoxy-1,4-benzoquinol methylase
MTHEHTTHSAPSSPTTFQQPTCPGCLSQSGQSYLKKFALFMSRCTKCELVFTYPAPTLEEVSPRYAQAWFENEYLPSFGINPSAPNCEHLRQRFLEELSFFDRYKKSGKLLDIGAGAGIFLWHARDRGWQVDGVELSEYGVNFARQHFGIQLVNGTLQQSSYAPGSFDVVTLQDVIEHISNPFEMLSDVNRLLRPGGIVSLATPNFSSLGRVIYQDDWALISPVEHLCLFNKKSLFTLLKATGFEVEEYKTAPSINLELTHGNASELGLRGKIVKKVAGKLSPKVIQKTGRGDEMYCIARKVS